MLIGTRFVQAPLQIAALASALLLSSGLTDAWAAKRVALVVGNNAYENVPVLNKALNDARSVAQTLTALGFEVVTAQDIGRRAMSRALVEMENRIEPGDTALFFFAGHGFAIDGTNYLLPVDVPHAGPGEEGLVRDEAFAASQLADRFRAKGAATAILILDACRDNPFAATGTRSVAGTRGLARMDPAEGMFVLYSAGAGQAALDELGPGDPHPNSVFTRVLLSEIGDTSRSMVQIAKNTQAKVREIAAGIGHNQTPAYYDQIIGDLFLAPEGASVSGGSLTGVTEGSGGVLPLPEEQKVAALPLEAEPIANFSRSNSGWTVSVSLPEAALQFGYKIGDDGEFIDAGLTDNIDQRTGRRMPKTWFNLPGDQPQTTIYVTWRDRRGEQADIFPITFNPNAALMAGQKKIVDEFWTSWISFREYNGLLVYFSHLITYRCAIDEVRYGIDDGAVSEVWPLPDCDPANPHTVPDDAQIYRNIPENTRSMSVQITYADGSVSETRSFNVPQ